MTEVVDAAIERTAYRKSYRGQPHHPEQHDYPLRLASPPLPLTYLLQNIARYAYAADELLQDPKRQACLIEAQDLPAIDEQISTLLAGATMDTEFRLKKPTDQSPGSTARQRTARCRRGMVATKTSSSTSPSASERKASRFFPASC